MKWSGCPGQGDCEGKLPCRKNSARVLPPPGAGCLEKTHSKAGQPAENKALQAWDTWCWLSGILVF